MNTTGVWFSLVVVAAVEFVCGTACESGDPGANPGRLGDLSQGQVCAAISDSPPERIEYPACLALDTDYTPRDAKSAKDPYPPCVSDEGLYIVSRSSGADGVSALGRVGAFEQIGRLLGFHGEKVPTPSDFVAARVLYSQDQGLESRVNRREDEHYPALAKPCQDLAEDDQRANAQRCVGPALIRPLLLEAFQAGAQGVGDATVHAARIEAGLLWFLYVSMHKEAISATLAKDDVDSIWAKYGGGEQREGEPLALARYVRERSQQVHDRIFDGILAVRCWRDLDNANTAVDLGMRDRALAQLDHALLQGWALILRSRMRTGACQSAFESAKVLGYVLDREATQRDPAQAEVLRNELAKDFTEADSERVLAALDNIFSCP